MFPETEKGYSRNLGLKGENYLDTLSKILRDEILPYVEKHEYNTLTFRPYQNDNAGETRKKVFKKIIDKFLPKDKFNFEEKNNTFIITKK